MPTTLTRKGQVTIPKRIRDATQWAPGTAIECSVNAADDVAYPNDPTTFTSRCSGISLYESTCSPGANRRA